MDSKKSHSRKLDATEKFIKTVVEEATSAKPQPQHKETKKKHKQKRTKTPGYSADQNASGIITTQKFSEQSQVPIAGTVNDIVYAVPLNPGDPTTFMRLSKLSQLYNEYRFKSLKVTWMPQGSAFAANNQTGEIVLGVQKDFYSSLPSNVQTHRSRKPNIWGLAWEPKCLHVPRRFLSRWRSVRDTPAIPGDARESDILLALSVNGTPSSGTIGFLQYEGEVELRDEYVVSVGGPIIQNHVSSFGTNTIQALTSGVAAYPVNSAGSNWINNVVGGGLAPWTPGVITGTPLFSFAEGTWRVSVVFTVNATTMTNILVALLPSLAVGANQYASPSYTRQWTGSTFSCSVWSGEVDQVFTIAEGGVSNAVYPFQITVTGTGSIQLDNWTFTAVKL